MLKENDLFPSLIKGGAGAWLTRLPDSLTTTCPLLRRGGESP
jgi:hypothetical protein